MINEHTRRLRSTIDTKVLSRFNFRDTEKLRSGGAGREDGGNTAPRERRRRDHRAR